MTLYKVLICAVILVLPFFQSNSEGREDHVQNVLDKVFDSTLEDIINEEDVGEGRFFFNYNQLNAFNSAVAFTMPLTILYTSRERKTSPTGEPIPNQYASYGYPLLIVIAGALFSIYTFQQGPNDGALNEALYRSHEHNLINYDLIHKVYNSIQKISTALDIENCAKLAICESHTRPKKYGVMATLIHLLFPVNIQKKSSELNDYTKAANFGYEAKDECYYEYQCLFQPLDVALYLKDYLKDYLKMNYL